MHRPSYPGRENSGIRTKIKGNAQRVSPAGVAFPEYNGG